MNNEIKIEQQDKEQAIQDAETNLEQFVGSDLPTSLQMQYREILSIKEWQE